jgi:D-glycero-D-manno-heptose 1,7-bisphosphate phosphatase
MLYLFDLDGTLITSYMDRADREFHAWELLPGRAERLAQLRSEEGEYHTIQLVSNQGGVAFGLVSEEDVQRKIAEVADALGYAAAWIWDGSPEQPREISLDRPASMLPSIGVLECYVCYADSRAKLPQYRQGAERRKPSGQMIREALASDAKAGSYSHQNLSSVIYVGDRPDDRDAAADADVAFQWAEEFFS